MFLKRLREALREWGVSWCYPVTLPPSFFSCPLRLHQLKLPIDPDKSVIATYLNQDFHLFLKYFSKLLQFWSEEE
jgi:hypothetical protein